MRHFILCLLAATLTLCGGCTGVMSKSTIGAVPSTEQLAKFKVDQIAGRWKATNALSSDMNTLDVRSLGNEKFHVTVVGQDNMDQDLELRILKGDVMLAEIPFKDMGLPVAFVRVSVVDSDHLTVSLANVDVWRKAVEAGELGGKVTVDNVPATQPGAGDTKPADIEKVTVELDATPEQLDAFLAKHTVDDLFVGKDDPDTLKLERVKP